MSIGQNSKLHRATNNMTMEELIEINIETADGVIDCRAELQTNDDGNYYNLTILYPNMVNGFIRSEVFCHDMFPDKKTGAYLFDNRQNEMHPKIMKLEAELSNFILSNR